VVDLKRSKGTGTGAHTSPRAQENRSPRFSDAEPQALPWKGPSSDEGDSGIAQTKAMRMLWGAKSYDQTHARGPFGGPFPELVSGLGLVTGRQRVRTQGWVEPKTLNAMGNPKRRETNAKGTPTNWEQRALCSPRSELPAAKRAVHLKAWRVIALI